MALQSDTSDNNNNNTNTNDNDRARAGPAAASANREGDEVTNADSSADPHSKKITSKADADDADDAALAAKNPSPIKTHKKQKTSTPIVGAARARDPDVAEDGADNGEDTAEDGADAADGNGTGGQVEEEVSDKEVAEGDADGKADNDNEESDGEVFVVERILEHVYDKKSRSRLYKVRWKGYGSDEDTWEPASSFTDKSFIRDYDKQQEMLKKSSTRESATKAETPSNPSKKRKLSSTSSTIDSAATPSKPANSAKTTSDRKSDGVNSTPFDPDQLPPILRDLDSWDVYIVKVAHIKQGIGRSRVPTDKLNLQVRLKLSSDAVQGESDELVIPLSTAMEKCPKAVSDLFLPPQFPNDTFFFS
ncbi:hypothetical protein HDU84_005756 [Entophlyctis sp. JEL0112]|nr:hypothetical protein HDU84_005756 [Entophlyctis sp. JEL0112]